MPSARIPIVVGLLGLVLIAHPLYLSLPTGDPLHPTFEPAAATVCSSTIAYTDLPPRARHSFDVTSHGDMPRFNDMLYTGRDSAAVEAFREHDCVRHDGERYDVYLIHEDGFDLEPATLLSPALIALGALLVGGAANLFLRDRRTG